MLMITKHLKDLLPIYFYVTLCHDDDDDDVVPPMLVGVVVWENF